MNYLRMSSVVVKFSKNTEYMYYIRTNTVEWLLNIKATVSW